ncbi:CbiX/SirB N-terminal domain-containing protein [Streptomyces sp. NPDC088745]|uniref:CbiX/SirB N-terminal domain-containing protein n=1 Tax=Streptomyces sp. NPDC088745 TaxID=3365884 RepID=UPI0038274831
MVAGAGSTRPGGNDGTLAVVDGFRGLRGVPVVPAHCSAAEPTVPEAVARLRAEGHRRVEVATRLLAPGRFTRAGVVRGVGGVGAGRRPSTDRTAGGGQVRGGAERPRTPGADSSL